MKNGSKNKSVASMFLFRLYLGAIVIYCRENIVG